MDPRRRQQGLDAQQVRPGQALGAIHQFPCEFYSELEGRHVFLLDADTLVRSQVVVVSAAGGGEHLEVVGELGRQSAGQPDVQEMFVRAVEMEEDRATMQQAMELYRRILTLRPRHAAAAINLGTMHYNLREFALAEQHYRAATEADPEYALAFFDLGNVLDELKRLPDAIAAPANSYELH